MVAEAVRVFVAEGIRHSHRGNDGDRKRQGVGPGLSGSRILQREPSGWRVFDGGDAADPVADTGERVGGQAAVQKLPQFDHAEARAGLGVGIDQVGGAVSVQVRPAHRGAGRKRGQSGERLPWRKGVVAEIEPVPALSRRGALEHQVGEAVAVDVGQFRPGDLVVVQREVRQDQAHRRGKPSVAQSDGQADRSGSDPGHVRHAVAVAVGDLDSGQRQVESAFRFDRDRTALITEGTKAAAVVGLTTVENVEKVCPPPEELWP